MRHSSVLYAPEQYDAAHICIAHDDHVASLNPNPQSFEYWMKDCAYLDQFLEDAVQDLIIILDSSRRTASLNTYNVVCWIHPCELWSLWWCWYLKGGIGFEGRI